MHPSRTIQYSTRPVVTFLLGLLWVVIVLPLRVLSQYDIDGNGTPDLLFVQPLSDGRIEWISQDLIDGRTTNFGVFGQAGWDLFLAPWKDHRIAIRTTLRHTEQDQFLLGIPGEQEKISLGIWPGRVVVNAGHDSNNNGIADALLVVERGKKLSWRFLFDPFTSQKSFKRILLAGQAIFLFSFELKAPRIPWESYITTNLSTVG